MQNLPEVIQKAKQGDKKAFGILYKEYYQRIYRYCKTNLYKDDVAEDVCQETFIRAWRSLPSFVVTETGTFQAYLYRIARNLIIDLGRKKKEFSLAFYEDIETDEDHIEAIDRKNNIDMVKRALAKLNDIDRQIVILRYFEEMSHAEVAKIIGIKEGALRVRTMRLLEKIKGLLE